MVYSPNFLPQLLNKEQVGVPDYVAALQKGFEAGNAPKKMASDLLSAALKQKYDAFKATPDYQNAMLDFLKGQGAHQWGQVDELRRKAKLEEGNPFINAPGDLGKVGALMYLQQHPEVMGDQQDLQNSNDNNNPGISYEGPGPNYGEPTAANTFPGRTGKPIAKPTNYQDLIRQSLTKDLMPKPRLVGPAAEAEALNQLGQTYGTESKVYQDALKLAALKQQNQESLTAQRDRRSTGLKPGEDWVKDSKGDNIGIRRDFSAAEKKEEKGRRYFNTVYPEILKSTSYYSGEGAIDRFAKDALKYRTDKKSQQRIDNYRAALKLSASALVKENATLGGSNTNQSYNRLAESINSSDLPKKLDKLVKEYGLPKEAELRAGQRFSNFLNKATKESQNLPARHTEYLDGDRRGHIYNPETKTLEEVIVGPGEWDAFTQAGGY